MSTSDSSMRERKQNLRKAIKAVLQQMPQDSMQAESENGCTSGVTSMCHMYACMLAQPNT
jgi:hypothetical protein